jgi:hypothetical protein
VFVRSAGFSPYFPSETKIRAEARTTNEDPFTRTRLSRAHAIR